ncbi:MAG: CBS domain-containing protein [Sphingomonas sp.]|nr:CBS domain-containing protein [Sphingomonas sp.]
MKVNECMTREVTIVDPDDTIEEAARTMADIDAGILPVGEDDRLVGMVTDRDIAIRGVGQGREPSAKVRDVMSPEVRYCFDDDDAEDVLNNMAELQVRRMPVLSRSKRLVGVISITDLALNGGEAHTGEVLREIARPSLRHSQTV